MTDTAPGRALSQFLRPISLGCVEVPFLQAVAGAVCVIPFLRFLCVHLLFRPTGRRVLPSSKDGPDGVSQLDKWEMACWSFLFYLVATLFGFYAMSREHAFLKPAKLLYGCSRLPCEYTVSNQISLQYTLQLAFYLQAVPSLYIWDVKRKDFYLMLMHHVVTIGLIVYSLWTNFVRFGAMILLLHDVCDVFLEGAKLLRYAERNDASTVVFGTFVGVWIAMRIVYFPFWMIDSGLKDPLGLIAIPYGVDPEPHYIFLNGLLIALCCFHLYWTHLILKIVWSVTVLKKEVDDIREEDTNKQ